MGLTVPTVAFWLFVGSMGLHVYLLVRFVKHVERSTSVESEKAEALRRLVFSGSGGLRQQLRALTYLLRREYVVLADEQTTRSGDRARASFYVALALMIGWAVSAMLVK
jgi:hypothetical protein